ncbi:MULTISPECIES: bifunctional demethylmenaquinone methyltransferase/2-methoxy-6-polyprenyl-1,4-benzoquinol methylase UbiE [Pontimonas]|uniref:Demethylmenaquinone methyltransferase n=1 Tax=Pontimonas salivibrio TaxID=1159327 RepID=A0A2L2BSQ1_9MICO|nr:MULTISPECIES: bifunctional demethylmenaquinone methyltransferase/2-methoxy-6-polyprenyl-1,4-benzoquinol methylase UbiE [Pontimonas]AVG24695.1 demethylmenaquinone methyltransferase menG [Pontimonas salivibrio]MDR9397335.1 bifunctional demethylmenaquinone methyltransferase/2-methoxy-6-polyprenyl-1,4-benzoquinol methylase UbiE [Pontimonas sp.]
MTAADLGKDPEQVAAMFTEVAKGYDRTNTVLSGGNATLWRIATVKALDPQPGERILDIAAGTGTSSVAIAKSGAEVVALDFSAGMVEEGRKRHPELTFVEGDAEALPFPPQSFDAVTISFGLRNVNNPQLAIGEMYRVLKPGGRLVICEFSHPDRAVVKGSYKAYLKYVMPAIAKVTSSNPEAYTYLMDSIREWPTQDVLAQWLRAAGFTRVAYRNLTGGIVALHRARAPESKKVRGSVAERRARPASPSTQANQTVTGSHR